MVPRAKEQERSGFASMNPHADKTRESPCLRAPPEHQAMTIRDRPESRVPDAASGDIGATSGPELAVPPSPGFLEARLLRII